MTPKPCTHKWFVDPKHSAFGLKNINAIVRCKFCKTTRYLGPVPVQKFTVTGDKTKRYWFDEDLA